MIKHTLALLGFIAWAGLAQAFTPVSTDCLSVSKTVCSVVVHTDEGDSTGAWVTFAAKELGVKPADMSVSIVDFSKRVGKDVLGHDPFPQIKKVGGRWTKMTPNADWMLWDARRPTFYKYVIPVKREWLANWNLATLGYRASLKNVATVVGKELAGTNDRLGTLEKRLDQLAGVVEGQGTALAEFKTEVADTYVTKTSFESALAQYGTEVSAVKGDLRVSQIASAIFLALLAIGGGVYWWRNRPAPATQSAPAATADTPSSEEEPVVIRPNPGRRRRVLQPEERKAA